ncbi:translation elongation factor 2 [Rickenella mellea]|uniref:Translation elongation factor 2 n=1 Tax=Rickenella mellea TaxID=50990 RepID=A0A4R5XEE3_9AGAM|nr:translation elongation factor 2 [Rickenella mellea]
MACNLHRLLRAWSRQQPRCQGSHPRRYLAVQSAQPQDPNDIRNIALVAHIDSGKTTLTESILHTSNYISTPGSVDTGSTTTDFLPAERERGITIQSASIPVKWKRWNYNLIDTPGHADFGMEVESASRVVDGAVVLIDSVEGVEAQTKGVWEQLNRYNVPTRLLFLNKLDRPGASFHSSLLSVLGNRLHPKPMPITLPVASFNPKDYGAAEPGLQGIVDLVKWETWRWHVDGTYDRLRLPRSAEDFENDSFFPSSHPLRTHLLPARVALLENLSMFSEDLMEKILALPAGNSSYLNIEDEVIISSLRSSVLRNEILPVLCGSALKHMGTDIALDYVGHLLASPKDMTDVVAVGQSILQVLAWKVCWDKRKGWMTFVRIYGGTLSRQSSLYNKTRKQRERISKLLLLYASQSEEVDFLSFGSVGVILGLRHTRTGDTLVSGHAVNSDLPEGAHVLRDITPPPAVVSASVIAQSLTELQPVEDALFALARTDPSLRVESLEGQLLIHGLGTLHLEIVEGRLRDEWGVQFQTGPRRVTYRETFAGDDMKFTSHWNTDHHGKLLTVALSLELRALRVGEVGDPQWDGNWVVDDEGKTLAAPASWNDQRSPWAYIAQGLASTLSNSPTSSLPLSAMRVAVLSFNVPDGAHPSILAGASSVILRRTLSDVGMGPIMEPFVRLKVDVTEDHFGRVIKDLTEHGGELLNLASQESLTLDDDALPFSNDGVYIPPAWLSPSSIATSSAVTMSNLKRTIYALAPLGKMLDFSNRLRAISGGHGTFEMFNAGFRPVSEPRKLEILKEIGRA